MDFISVYTRALSGNPSRESAFWFLYTGVLLLLIGSFVDYLERLDLDIPLVFVITFTVLVFLGIIVIPVSGFWLLIAPMIGLIARERRFKAK